MSEINWLEMPHELPEGTEKYLMMLIEAGNADNELKLLTRFQKVIRKMHDDQKSAYDKLKADNTALKKQIEELKEYKAMYEGPCK